MLIRRSSKNIWRSIAKWTHMHKPQNGCFPTFLFCYLTGIRRRQELSFMPPQNFGGRVKTAKHCLDQKLQTDKLSILVRFLKKFVALLGNVSQMYHQLALTPEDRKPRRCLWRDLDQSKEPDVWEFLRYVFGGGGGCYWPFCAQYAWQKHADDHKAGYSLSAEAVKKGCYLDDLMPSVALK